MRMSCNHSLCGVLIFLEPETFVNWMNGRLYNMLPLGVDMFACCSVCFESFSMQFIHWSVVTLLNVFQ